MSFNDYLKYVKGHSMDANGAMSYLDRLMTALSRKSAENDFIVKGIMDPVEIKNIKIHSFEDCASFDLISYLGRKVSISIDLNDLEIDIAQKVDVNQTISLSEYDKSKVINKMKVNIDLFDLLHTSITSGDDPDDEAFNYIKNGKETIGINNIEINCMVIYTIKALEELGVFDTNGIKCSVDVNEDYDDDITDDSDDEEDIPEEYRSSEPGAPAHPDNGNTRWDKTAESGI